MLNLGLSRAERRAFNAALTGEHKTRIRGTLMSLEHKHLTQLDDRIEDGQVTGDASAEQDRQATMTLFDPNGHLPLDSKSPADGALFMDRMVRIYRDVKPPGEDWVEVPIFTGPITSLSRSGDYITVEAAGKEILLQGMAFYPHTYKKHRDKVDVIRAIARDYGGNRRFDLRDAKGRLKKPLSLKRESIPWDLMQNVAESMGMQLFFDARGWLRLRVRPGNVAWKFSGGNDGEIMTDPEVSYTLSEGFANAVWVKGGSRKLKGKHPNKNYDREDDPDTPGVDESVTDIGPEDDPHTDWDETTEHAPAHFLLTAPRSHPLSPWNLGANGVPRFYLHVIENDKIKTRGEAKKVAHEALDRKLDEAFTLTYDSLVIPHLELGDLTRAHTDELNAHSRLKEFAIPFGTEELMNVGYSRDITPRRRHRRGHHHHNRRHPSRR